MRIKVGEVDALFRYPGKCMRGELLDVADLGWHGLDGPRRLAFRRADVRGGFPWLPAQARTRSDPAIALRADV